MATLQTGTNKIKQICEVLKEEALLPAQQEAEDIISKAQSKAESVVSEAHEEADRILSAAREKIEQEKNVFDAALIQASKQCLQALRQDIEQKLFDGELEKLVARGSSDPNLVARLVSAIVAAVDKEGLSTDLSVVIAESVSKDEVNKLLADEIIKRLRENGVVVGQFAGGGKVCLHDEKLTFDVSDVALKELLGHYVRKEFREILFSS